MNNLVEYLRSFQPLSDATAEAVLKISRPIKLEKHHLIHRAGDICQHIYLIVHGIARVFYYRDGKDITSHFILERDIIAAMDSLYSRQPSYYSIELLEDCELISVSYRKLEQLYTKFHDLESIGRRLAIECYLEENERNRSFQMYTAKERYLQLLEKHYDLPLRVKLGHIASYVGVTQVQLSRIRAEKVAF